VFHAGSMLPETPASSVSMEKLHGFGLWPLQPSLHIERMPPISTNGAWTDRTHWISTPAWILLPVPVSSWTTQRSSNPLSNATACTCEYSGQGTRRGVRLDEVNDRPWRHWARKQVGELRYGFFVRVWSIPYRAMEQAFMGRSVLLRAG
jgi:hypothetical protein